MLVWHKGVPIIDPLGDHDEATCDALQGARTHRCPQCVRATLGYAMYLRECHFVNVRLEVRNGMGTT